MTPPRLGLAGGLTRAFITSPLTPLFLLAAIVFGIVALISLPREEEPQISVPMVDIHVRADGLKAEDAVKLITEPLETIVKGIDGVEHVYSQTQDDQVMVTARFLVGTSSDAAILRVHEKLRANMDRIPVGVPEPLIVGRGIDDVAILALTLSPKPDAADRITPNDLTRIARELRSEVAKIENVGLTYLVGETDEMIRIAPDPERLALYGVTLQQLAAKVSGANSRLPGRPGPRRSRADHAGRRRDPAQPRGDRQPAGHHPRRPAGLRARRRRRGLRHRKRRRAGLDRRAGGRHAAAGSLGDARHRQARRLERRHRRRRHPAPGRGPARQR